MENIEMFTKVSLLSFFFVNLNVSLRLIKYKACKEYGLNDSETFQTCDLWVKNKIIMQLKKKLK